MSGTFRIQRIYGLSQVFRDTAAWQYDDVPGHTLIGPGEDLDDDAAIRRWTAVVLTPAALNI